MKRIAWLRPAVKPRPGRVIPRGELLEEHAAPTSLTPGLAPPAKLPPP
jgi:hypothetical protein